MIAQATTNFDIIIFVIRFNKRNEWMNEQESWTRCVPCSGTVAAHGSSSRPPRDEPEIYYINNKSRILSI